MICYTFVNRKEYKTLTFVSFYPAIFTLNINVSNEPNSALLFLETPW